MMVRLRKYIERKGLVLYNTKYRKIEGDGFEKGKGRAKEWK